MRPAVLGMFLLVASTAAARADTARVSAHLQQVPLRAALAEVCRNSEFVVVVDPDVPDTPVTIQLCDVPRATAVSIILRLARGAAIVLHEGERTLHVRMPPPVPPPPAPLFGTGPDVTLWPLAPASQPGLVRQIRLLYDPPVSRTGHLGAFGVPFLGTVVPAQPYDFVPLWD